MSKKMHSGTTTRQRISNRDRLKIWERDQGICHLCQGRIAAGEPWQLEHKRALELGGEDAPENMAPAHIHCHKTKTKDDHQRTAKAKRVKLKHLGGWVSRTPMACGRKSKWKKKLDGSVVPR
jgi:5-methylcytosine-specific restriction endonuclease McrA